METVQMALANPVVRGAAYALLGAVLVDLHAWSQSDEAFNWRKAAKRYVGVVVVAVGTAVGISVL
jgi:hypothetical protein